LECFSAGVELRTHKAWHNYRVIEELDFPLLCPDWTANEEQLLLEGLELYGIGNWLAISEYISTKDKNQCKAHFDQFYIGKKEWPSISYDDCDPKPYSSKRQKCIKLSRKQEKVARQKKQTAIPSHFVDVPSATAKKIKPSPPAKPHLSFYMPKREEFENEWDDGCEEKIMDIEFCDGDSVEIFELKMKLLELYNIRLAKRREMRKLVVEKKLHDMEFQKRLSRTRTTREKKLNTELKTYIRVMNVDEYEEFLKGEARQKELEEKVRELQRLLSTGHSAVSSESGCKTTTSGKGQDTPPRKRKASRSPPAPSETSSLQYRPVISPLSPLPLPEYLPTVVNTIVSHDVAVPIGSVNVHPGPKTRSRKREELRATVPVITPVPKPVQSTTRRSKRFSGNTFGPSPVNSDEDFLHVPSGFAVCAEYLAVI